MTKRKYFYYIGVQTHGGLSWVTSMYNENKMCFWDIDKTPLPMSKEVASDYAEGLCMNLHTAVVIKSFWELTTHFVSNDEHANNLKGGEQE